MPKLTDLDIGQQRLFLVREIESYRPHGSLRNSITIIFDGRPGPVQPIQSSIVDIVFSYDDTADDRIKEAVRQAQNSKSYVVVTDDRAIQYAVRADGAKVLVVKEFLNRLKPVKSRSNSKGSHRGISSDRADEINTELKNLWLKKKKDE